jgi:hypothetical protein
LLGILVITVEFVYFVVLMIEHYQNEIQNKNYITAVVLGVLKTIYEHIEMIEENEDLFV